MYSTLVTSHSHLRWLVLVAAVLAILLPMLNARSEISKKSKFPALAFMITCDIQLLLGALLYFVYSPFGVDAFEQGMSFVMKNGPIRKIAVEHFILMLLALAIVHIGYSKVKKAANSPELSKLSIKFFGLALIVILVAIPWTRF